MSLKLVIRTTSQRRNRKVPRFAIAPLPEAKKGLTLAVNLKQFQLSPQIQEGVPGAVYDFNSQSA
jgi:hypothetical protein